MIFILHKPNRERKIAGNKILATYENSYFQIFWIATAIKYSVQTKLPPVEKYSCNNELNITTTLNKTSNGQFRDKREASPEFKIIKHKSRPSKRHPGYRGRRRPKPKPVYGPPNFTYGSPISDYTLGYSSKGKKTKNGSPSSFGNANSDTQYESNFAAPTKTNLYSGHSSYDSSFKNVQPYISPPSSGLLPSLPPDYGSDSSFSYTPPPLDSYPNQGYNNFAEPPKFPKIHDLAGAGTHTIKSIPPSTNYGVPVAPIHQQSHIQNTQTSINQPQESYISNLYNSFSTPTTSEPQHFYNLPNLQPTYTNPGIHTGINAISGINGNIGNVNPGVGTSSVGDPSFGNALSKFNQNTLNTLTFKTYATSQPPQVKYNPGSVTISSSKEITPNRPPSGKFAEPPRNYVHAYLPPLTSYDVPLQHDSSKTAYNIDAPENQFEPTIYKSAQNHWNELPSTTTTERYKYLPPILPTAYDQNQFNSFSNENSEYSSNYNQQPEFLDADGDYGSLFDVPHESKKIPKTKLTKTYAGTNLKAEDSSIESVEIPSDEYVDELISATTTTKRPRTRRRRPKPTTQSTTPHILDTEDLRDAFSSGTVQYSLSVNPNDKASRKIVKSPQKTANDKNFVLLSSANTNRTWNRQYPNPQMQTSYDPINDVKEFLQNDSSERTNSSKRGIEILSIQQSKSHSYYAGTVAPPESIKQKGINARYDQPKYDDSMFNVVSTNVRVAHKGNNKLAAGVKGSRRTKKQNFDESKEIEDDDDTAEEIDPIFWNGRRLPDNHKIAKRIASR